MDQRDGSERNGPEEEEMLEIEMPDGPAEGMAAERGGLEPASGGGAVCAAGGRVRFGTQGEWVEVAPAPGETRMQAALRRVLARSGPLEAPREGDEDPLIQARGATWYLILC